MMTIRVDRKVGEEGADAAYIEFDKGGIVYSEEVKENESELPLCVIDRGENQKIMGVELFNISQGIRLERVPEEVRPIVEEKLREEGIEIVP